MGNMSSGDKLLAILAVCTFGSLVVTNITDALRPCPPAPLRVAYAAQPATSTATVAITSTATVTEALTVAPPTQTERVVTATPGPTQTPWLIRVDVPVPYPVTATPGPTAIARARFDAAPGLILDAARAPYTGNGDETGAVETHWSYQGPMEPHPEGLWREVDQGYEYWISCGLPAPQEWTIYLPRLDRARRNVRVGGAE